jgi:hypothetical protein
VNLKSRINRLESLVADAGCTGCTGCEPQVQHMQMEYKLADGTSVRLPELPDPPPCTCKRSRSKSREVDVIGIIVVRPQVVPNRAEAERLFAEYSRHHKPWQPTRTGSTPP